MEKQQGVVKKIFESKNFIISGVVILLLLGIIFGRAYYKNYQFRMEVRQKEADYQKLLGENGDLRSLLERVKSADYPEKIGRSNFNLVNPGENVLVLVDDSDQNSRQNKKEVLESIKISNPREWWNYFFNRK